MGRKVRRKKLPVGIENFEKIRSNGFYYIDKTGLIRDLLDGWGEVNLFTRPRRFGKSLNMSMLKCFFEIGCDRNLFDGLEITKETDLCEEYMGQFPVISVSLKGVGGEDFLTARSLMCSVIGDEVLRFYDLLMNSKKLNPFEKERYRQLIAVDVSNQESYVMSDSVLIGSLKTLSQLLQKHYGKKVLILIDEYDVPLAKASEQGYYDKMVFLIRSIFEKALKTNDSLYFAVLTGCLRVSKESIFTGFNNPKMLTIMDVQFDEYFGFTDYEIREILDYYDLGDAYKVIKEWYDGYRFGNRDVYCPWDVVSYIDKRKDNPKLEPENYWSNTSSNDIVRHFLEKASAGTRSEIEQLIAGESVTKIIKKELTYKELYDSIENVWSILFMTGYLTQRGDARGDILQLAIPNKEIQNIFMTQIYGWMQEKALRDGEFLDVFCEAFKKGNADEVQRLFSGYLSKTISIRDTAVRKELKENFYHGVLLGLLRYKEAWSVKSNRESGNGYTDIVIEIWEEKIGIVIEVKYADSGNLDAGCREAMEQIEKKNYIDQPKQDGMKMILKCGFACHAKDCKVIFEITE